ncbi:neutral alpha-glucosidase ab [Stylonychia lemnae]|uniref:Neutral alpha-glucosidase ab n=1 Tax=Stylonychia lemnae TaxID=5949 RepID=A0A078AKE6_STYLE|nr:neutral alpha-glucosidase ab [Stylonychia lemnae]|eukprot:CDW82855.1 neutral alpha-glucosidase ab [Stylonychia lemnae]
MSDSNNLTARFGITDIGIGIEKENLKQIESLADKIQINGDQSLTIKTSSEDKKDKYEYELQFKNFRLIQRINGIQTMIVNHKDSLYFENTQFLQRKEVEYQKQENECIYQLFPQLSHEKIRNYFSLDPYSQKTSSSEGFLETWDFRESYSMGVYFPTPFLFGIPERLDTFRLKSTEGRGQPYRMTALDVYPHDTTAREGTYSSLPYIQGHSVNFDSSLLWMTAAGSFIDIYDQMDELTFEEGRFVDFVTESGRLEIYMFGSAVQNSPRRIQKIMAELTGYQALPPIYTLGYHYCKWESELSANRMMEWNRKFSESKIPVDVFWMDIPYTDDSKYFAFSPRKFPENLMAQMKKEVQEKNRHFVVITDPHVKLTETFRIYKEALQLHQTNQSNDLVSMFVRQRNGNIFKGLCWPGESVWIDFFNKGARDFWSKLYNFDYFLGTDDSFNIWLDMNEPSVFDGPEATMPKDALHQLSNGQVILSKDVKTVYGRMMLETTYNGLKARNTTEPKRPFILTRNTFFGGQKFAAKWTGDNSATFQELSISISQILSLSITGIQFVGADVPGYAGQPTDELYVMFYQLGIFYPFFRYTSFYQANKDGSPIARPLWYEFPSDTDCFGINTQFMYGDSLMIAPKLVGLKKGEFSNQKFRYKVPIYLPKDSEWYYWFNRTEKITSQSQLPEFIDEDEQGIFIRAGSIITIKQHEGRESIMQAINDDISLEIYADKNQKARGHLYIDDGITFRNQEKNERLYIEFNFENGNLYYVNSLKNNQYDNCLIKITNVLIYGLTQNVRQESVSLKSGNADGFELYKDFQSSNILDDVNIDNLTLNVDSQSPTAFIPQMYENAQVSINGNGYNSFREYQANHKESMNLKQGDDEQKLAHRYKGAKIFTTNIKVSDLKSNVKTKIFAMK